MSRLKYNMCWLPGRYSPTVCGVHIFYRYSQRPLLMGWKIKENTATPNHEHSNQRQQLIHFKKTCPFQGRLLSFQSSACKASSTSNPKVSRWKLHLLGLHNVKRSFERTRTNVHILIFITKIHVSLIGGTVMVTWLHIAVTK